MTSKEIKRIKKTLDTLEAGFVKRAKSLFDSAIAEFEPWVDDLFRTKNFENIEVPGRKRYLVLFKRYIQELYVQGMNLADLELEAKRAQFEIQGPPPIIPTGAMNWIDKWTDTFGNDCYGDMTQDVVRTLKSSLERGLGVKGTMEELSHYLTGPACNERRLEVIARTNATTAFNQGRLETFRQAGDFVQFVQFLAILDSRTTAICESRNGLLMRLDSPELAANTPPLHYQCRSMLSPVTKYDLRDMAKPGWKDEDGKSFEELLDWSKVATPSKGFGEMGKVIEGKLSKGKEKNYMDFIVSDEEIHETVDKFKLLREKHPHTVGEIDEKALRNIADYLADRRQGRAEPAAWDMIKKGNLYSYSCCMHENTEIALRKQESEYLLYHGGALYEQYTFLKNLIHSKTGRLYDIVELCYNDYWIEHNMDIANEGTRDWYNADRLRRYLKEYTGEFIPIKHSREAIIKGSPSAKRVMEKLRQTGEISENSI